ncbi:MAG: Trk system potassium transporter TrkA [Halobacteriales archaeon]
MNVLILGGGEVGWTIAEVLQHDHEVTIVERDVERADELNYELDVIAVAGDGMDPDTLHEAEIEAAELVLATTNDDPTNIIACGTAKALADAFTVARVKDTKYLRTWREREGAFGIDYMVATDFETAATIAQVVGLPTARDSDLFAGDAVQMAEFQLSADSPVAGQTIAEADRFESLTFAAVMRNGEVEIPRGDTRLGADDRIVVIGSPESVQAFSQDIAPEASPTAKTDVVIVGGSEVGYHVARLLGERGLAPRLIEEDPVRAREIAEALPRTTVMQSDATDVGFLRREHVDEADVLVAVLGNDERNLLAVLLAKRLGVDRAVATVERPSYADLFEAVGLDVGISPRTVIAEEITRFTQAGDMENVAFIETDKAEVIEVEVDADSVLAGRSIAEAMAALPEGVAIGAITRDGSVIVPRGRTEVDVGDHVIAFVDIAVVDEVSARL